MIRQTWDVELIHEPTGTYMNFEWESETDKPLDFAEVAELILTDISVVAQETAYFDEDE